MYKVVSKGNTFLDKHGNNTTAVLTLKDSYGGIVHIAVDDGCYVLYLENISSKGQASMYHWWFPAAVSALKTLPDNARKTHYEKIPNLYE